MADVTIRPTEALAFINEADPAKVDRSAARVALNRLVDGIDTACGDKKPCRDTMFKGQVPKGVTADPNFLDDYGRLAKLMRGEAGVAFPVATAAPEEAPASEESPPPESEPAPTGPRMPTSPAAPAGEPVADPETPDEPSGSGDAGFAGQVSFGLTAPVGLTAPGGNNTPQSESWGVMPQIGGEVGVRNGPVGAFIHGSVAVSRTSSPNSAGEESYNIEEGNAGDTYGLAVKARLGAQLRIRAGEHVEPLIELGGVFVHASDVQQGLIRDTTISDKAPYFAVGAAFPISDNIALGLKLYGDGHAGTQRTSPSGGAPRRSGLGGNDAFNLSGGIFGEVRF